MAKQKGRFKKKKKHRRASNPAFDSHHLCYQRRWWRRGVLLELRRFHYCIVHIPRNTVHRAIHEHLDSVPTPKEINARTALEQLKMLERYNAIHDDDPIEKRLMILAALFDCCDQPTADAFRTQIEIVNEFKTPT